MHIHILGICGTFMGGLAVIAKQLGHKVSGSDDNVYPPMSTQLANQDIMLHQGYKIEHITAKKQPDLIIIGNTMKRNNEVIEYILNNNLPYTSGPQWLKETVLNNRHVLAVAGTHGKTTTTGMLAWILTNSGKNPGFLCGGVPNNLNVSASLGNSPFFVIEADEYDTAFFDKRSKFVHYQPRTLVINNIEFDHADIFANLDAIKQQFAHLLRIVPNQGLIIYPNRDNNIANVLHQGHWTPTTTFSHNDQTTDWYAQSLNTSCDKFAIYHKNNYCGTITWQLAGIHNINNALAAIAAANHIGISAQESIQALSNFSGIRRRLELIGVTKTKKINIYDDFAHHPTAIATTIQGLKSKNNNARVIAITELASNTMRSGAHGKNLILVLNNADAAFILLPQTNSDNIWRDLNVLLNHATVPMFICNNIDELIPKIDATTKANDNILFMSNKNTGNIPQKLLQLIDYK